jgi:hypothetical protein
VCLADFNISHSGENDIKKKHINTIKHRQASAISKSSVKVDYFFV